ncbi:hypothetical protein HPB47_009259 [Ixodes persulcatus]|uniref:Uncharacterized protein n=1 Tax=Ixodes persulcatus TaxID=34615 RepID=A0AC60P2G0_IXOPE|nr:hypothetical protein HPB47_009259 [Ixodes persulcatus]
MPLDCVSFSMEDDKEENFMPVSECSMLSPCRIDPVLSEPRDWCYLEEDSALCHVICDGDYELCFAAKSGVFIDGINEPWAMSQATLEQELLFTQWASPLPVDVRLQRALALNSCDDV